MAYPYISTLFSSHLTLFSPSPSLSILKYQRQKTQRMRKMEGKKRYQQLNHHRNLKYNPSFEDLHSSLPTDLIKKN